MTSGRAAEKSGTVRAGAPRPGPAFAAVLVMWLGLVVAPGADRAAAAPFCLTTPQPTFPSCDAIWSGNVYGTITASPALPAQDELVTVTATVQFPPVRFTRVEGDVCVASGPSSITLSVPGEIVAVSPETSADLPIVVSGTSARMTGGPEEAKPDPTFPTRCSNAIPTSRIPLGTSLSVTFRYTAGGQATARATFGGNAGFVGWNDSAIWYFYSDNQPPTANFTWEERTDSPLTVDFDASASTDDTGIAAYEWDFGDGTTGGGVIASHTFSAPGTYAVRLKVTDTDGASASLTKRVVLAPRLEVTVRLPDDVVEPLEIGQEVDVAVVVASPAAAGAQFSGVRFVGAPLDVGDQGRLVVVSGPQPLPPASFSLAAGESKSFAYRLRAAARGRVTLASRVQGKDAAGKPAEAAASRQVQVGPDPLRVEVLIDPPAVDLEDDENGHIPRAVVAQVTVTNVLDVPISDVTLEPLDLRSRRLPAPVPASLVVLSGPFGPGPAPQPPEPSALGTLAPASSTSRLATTATTTCRRWYGPPIPTEGRRSCPPAWAR